MSRKIVLYMLCAALAFSRPAAAEESAEDVSRRYHEAGVADAEAMARKFEEAVKPRYQRAYDNYLADLANPLHYQYGHIVLSLYLAILPFVPEYIF